MHCFWDVGLVTVWWWVLCLLKNGVKLLKSEIYSFDTILQPSEAFSHYDIYRILYLKKKGN